MVFPFPSLLFRIYLFAIFCVSFSFFLECVWMYFNAICLVGKKNIEAHTYTPCVVGVWKHKQHINSKCPADSTVMLYCHKIGSTAIFWCHREFFLYKQQQTFAFCEPHERLDWWVMFTILNSLLPHKIEMFMCSNVNEPRKSHSGNILNATQAIAV